MPPASATDQPLSPIELQGQVVFTIHCAACHATAPDTVIVGPSLAGIAVRGGERLPGIDAESYIRDSIIAPYDYLVEGFTETMPPDFGIRLSGEEFDAVVAYLLSLK
jgi:nitric oxide reductase subunit C